MRAYYFKRETDLFDVDKQILISALMYLVQDLTKTIVRYSLVSITAAIVFQIVKQNVVSHCREVIHHFKNKITSTSTKKRQIAR